MCAGVGFACFAHTSWLIVFVLLCGVLFVRNIVWCDCGVCVLGFIGVLLLVLMLVGVRF